MWSYSGAGNQHSGQENWARRRCSSETSIRFSSMERDTRLTFQGFFRLNSLAKKSMSRMARFLLECVFYRIFLPTGNPEEPYLITSDKTHIWHAICAAAFPESDPMIREVCHGYGVDACGVF